MITRARRAGRAPLMVSCLDGLALVTIEGTGIFGQPGMVLRLLSPVAAAGTNIYMISMSSSEYSISFAIRALGRRPHHPRPESATSAPTGFSASRWRG